MGIGVAVPHAITPKLDVLGKSAATLETTPVLWGVDGALYAPRNLGGLRRYAEIL
jgi:hypothetical protein